VIAIVIVIDEMPACRSGTNLCIYTHTHQMQKLIQDSIQKQGNKGKQIAREGERESGGGASHVNSEINELN